MLPPAAADNALLGLALSRRDALELSVRELAAERAKVAEEAAAAADRLADDILDAEGYEIGDDVISSMQLHWKLLDRLTGLILLDERRQGGPGLRELQKKIVEQIDRRKLAIATNPLFVETHAWNSHLNGISADAERVWRDYRTRLTLDAAIDVVE